MSALFTFWHGMLAHLWQTTLILAFILIIERTLRAAPARANHTLWSIALAKAFLPLPFFGYAASVLYGAVSNAAAGNPTPAPTMLEPVAAVLFPLPGTGAPAAGSTGARVIIAATACWAALVVYSLVRTAADIARARRYGGTPNDPLAAAAQGKIDRILAAAGIPAARVLVSGNLVMPGVSGLLRPRIVISERLLNELPDEELRAILVHEDAHRRRRDPLRTAACRVARALFFFYPPIYPLMRRLRTSAEFACDESVISAGVSSRTYSRALARTLKLGLSSPPITSGAAAERSLLRRRLERLSTLDPRRYAMHFRHYTFIVLAALVAAAATFWPGSTCATRAAAPISTSARTQNPSAGNEFYPFDTAPAVKEFQPAAYPEPARSLGIETVILLIVTIDERGRVLDALVIPAAQTKARAETFGELEGEAVRELERARIDKLRALFERSAREAVMKWVFEPAALDGKNVPARVAVPVAFKLR